MSNNYEILDVRYSTSDGIPEPMVNMERLFALYGYDLTQVNPNEENEELDKLYTLFGECYAEMAELFEYKICYTAFGYDVLPDRTIDLDFAKVKSDILLSSLIGSEYMVAFAATLGSEAHNFLKNYKSEDVMRKKCILSLAYERLFTLCDAFGDDLHEVVKADARTLRPFIQPGDGDLPESFKAEIVKLLETEEHIGVKLDEEGNFDPLLTVTGIFCVTERGLVQPGDCCTPEMCETCSKEDCDYRK